jgi:hypothetical protein
VRSRLRELVIALLLLVHAIHVLSISIYQPEPRVLLLTHTEFVCLVTSAAELCGVRLKHPEYHRLTLASNIYLTVCEVHFYGFFCGYFLMSGILVVPITVYSRF